MTKGRSRARFFGRSKSVRTDFHDAPMNAQTLDYHVLVGIQNISIMHAQKRICALKADASKPGRWDSE